MDKESKTPGTPSTKDAKPATKVRSLELERAGSYNAVGLKEPIRKGAVVTSDSVAPELFERMVKTGLFKTLLLAMVIGLMSLAPVSAQADGTNFTYPHKIGWGGSFLDQLATVFADIDAAFTSTAGEAVQVADLASTANGQGLSLIGIEDAGTYFGGATDAEAALQLIGPTMTDDRDPNAHAISHATGSTDAIAPADIGAATAADIAVLDEKVAPYLPPVIAAWDPTGPVDPPTANDGDRYMASATDGAYTATYIYESNGATWAEYVPNEADTTYNEDTDVQIVYDGAAWNAMGGGSSTADVVLGDQARRSTASTQTTTTATPLKITFETEEVAGDVTYLAGDFTVPVDGVYAIAASLTFDTSAAGDGRLAYIYVNGAAFDNDDAPPDGANPVVVPTSAVLYLAASDVVAIYGEQDSGGDLDVTAGRVAVQRIQ